MAKFLSFPAKLKALLRAYAAEDIGKCLASSEYERLSEVLKGMDAEIASRIALLRSSQRQPTAEALYLEGMAVHFAGLLTDLERAVAARDGHFPP